MQARVSAHVPLRSWRIPGTGDKIRSGYITLAFSGAQKWAELLRNPCVLGGSEERTKSKEATSPLPSRGPTTGQNCYVTLAFSGVPRRGDKIRGGYITPCLLRGPTLGRIAMPPRRSQGSPHEATKSQVATSPVPSRGPTSGQNCYVTLACSGVQKQGEKIRSGYISPAFSSLAFSGPLEHRGYVAIPPIFGPPRKHG